MDEQIKSIISQSYNENAKLRDSNIIVDWKQVELDKFITYSKQISEFKLLDMGAGSGIYAEYFKNQGLNVNCIDISEGMINLCNKKGLKAEVMDFYDLRYEDSSFDGVWSLNTLLHVPKSSIEIVLKEVKRVLKEGGVFYLGIYGGESSEGIWKNDFYEPKRYFSFYTDSELLTLLRRYFHIEVFESIEIGSKEFEFQSVVMTKEKS